MRRDLNEIVGQGKNWRISVIWAPLIRYVAAPILAIVYSFSYPAFYELRYDPLHILGFGVGHIVLLLIASGFVLPRWYDPLIPPTRRGDGKIDVGPNVTAVTFGLEETREMEEGSHAQRDETKGSPVVDGLDHADSSERVHSEEPSSAGRA